MATLNLLLNGKSVAEFSLNTEREQLMGRDKDCDFVLPSQPGISRRHCRLWFEDNNWHIEVLSQYGGLSLNGMELKKDTLRAGAVYKLGPFQLVLENVPTVTITQSLRSPKTAAANPDEEKTLIGGVTLSPELVLKNKSDKVIKKFHLKGSYWLAGRDVICDIPIEDPKTSRRQFEIRKNADGFSIRDLGSANGTLLNGVKLQAQWSPLMSGDKIKVGNWTLDFELRDNNYVQKLQGVQPYNHTPAVYDGAESPLPFHAEGEAEMPMAAARKRSHLVRYATLALVLVAGVGYFMTEEGPVSEPVALDSRSPAAKTNVGYEKLNPDQQQFVRQTHKLAKELFMQGRYEMARQEILKIYQFVDSYEDSKEIENAAFQAVQIQQEKSRIEAQEKEKIEIEEKIQKQLQICRAKINPSIGPDELDNCLAPVIQFDPEHAGILDLKKRVDEITVARNMKKAAADDWREKLNKQIALFNKAKAQATSGDSLSAIKAFRAIYNSPTVSNTEWKGKAKQEIDILQKDIDVKQKQYKDEADSSIKAGKLKDAILALTRALAFNPEDEVMKGKINSLLSELRKQMQTIYQEGILEESVGEVETAKTKWKKIIESSLPQEEYYKKAVIKLKKYGAL